MLMLLMTTQIIACESGEHVESDDRHHPNPASGRPARPC
jgi:hypothetical protein